MRRLAWFSGGFAAACLWACCGGMGALPLLAAALPLAALLAVWLRTRPRSDEHPILLRRPREKGPLSRYGLYQLSRRGLALSLGALLALGWAWGYHALFRAPAEAWVGEEVPLSGQVCSYPAPTSIGGYSVTLRLDGGALAPDVLLFGPADWAELKPGDRLGCTARVTPSDQAWGEETAYYTARGVYLLAYCRGEAELRPAQGVPPQHWPALCAQALRRGIGIAFDGTAAPIAAAVTLGDKSGLDGQLHSALNRVGLMHAAVVSGMHISFLVGLGLALGGRRAALALVPLLVFYALMAGGTPSALRAVIMQCALLAAPLARREEDGPSALGLALLILLVQNPFAAASVSLQLSFASVAGLMLAARPLFRRLYRPWKALRPSKERKLLFPLWRAGRAVLSGVSVSLGAMLFTTPLIAWYFGQIELLAPLSNVLALWALSLLLVCSLVLGPLALLLPGPAGLLGRAAGLLGHYVRWAALGLGRFPFASLSTHSRYCLIWLGAVYLVLLAALWSRRREPGRPLVSAAALGLLLCAALGLGRLEADSAQLTVTALDVGQGASTALVSGGRTALVDCGGTGAWSPGDVAADYFAAQGRARLDLLVLTHFDADHFNGVEQLFYRMEVDRVAIPGGGTDPGDMARLTALAGAEGAEVLVVDQTEELALGRAVLTLFPPLGGGTSNESGLFALCTAGDFDVLITGDADAFVEKMLVKYYPIPDIELLLVGHHGSRTSTCRELLDAAAPELAVISAGRNSYGHPDPSVVERLEDFGARVYCTLWDGSVTAAVRGDRVSIS